MLLYKNTTTSSQNSTANLFLFLPHRNKLSVLTAFSQVSYSIFQKQFQKYSCKLSKWFIILFTIPSFFFTFTEMEYFCSFLTVLTDFFYDLRFDYSPLLLNTAQLISSAYNFTVFLNQSILQVRTKKKIKKK